MRAVLAAVLLAGTASAKEPPALRSGPGRTALLELFTSEGCSSCPGADAWLGALERAPGLYTAFVPVGFHVDYWDQLGWPDPWASPAYTRRQRRHADRWGDWRVYTPGFVFDGAEGRPGRLPERPGAPAGTLEAGLTGRAVTLRFTPAAATARPARAFAAELGLGLESVVKRGENAGRVLRHSFTALALADAELACATGVCSATLTLPPAAAAAPKRALAVWVEDAEGRPLQAAGGPL